MNNNFNFEVLCNKRGAIKEYMGIRRIRRIDIHNYLTWKGFKTDEYPVKCVRLDILNGYLDLYDVNNHKISTESAVNLYTGVYDMVMEIFKNEKMIPYNKRKNIIVKVNR